MVARTTGYLCDRFINEKDKRHEECWRRTMCTLSFRTPRHAKSFWPVHTLHHPTVSIQRIVHGPFLFVFLDLPPSVAPPLPLDCWGTDLRSFIAISYPTAVLTAMSKISCTPFISLLLHSTYVAPICLATLWPCSGVTGVKPWVLSRSIHARFVRRSDLRPTRMRGVVGQKWSTSGYH